MKGSFEVRCPICENSQLGVIRNSYTVGSYFCSNCLVELDDYGKLIAPQLEDEKRGAISSKTKHKKTYEYFTRFYRDLEVNYDEAITFAREMAGNEL